MVSFEMTDIKKIGLGLTGFGVFFSFLGVILFFDKGLLAMGNILFLSGVMLTIGMKSTMQFFTKRKNFKGTISFSVGFLLVLIGWPLVGMMLEAYGFVVLFSGFWPTVAVFLQRIPVIGWLFQQPFITSFIDRYRGKRVPGLDLSPYFLAVAQYKENKKSPDARKITWIHANGESTGLPSNSFDLVSIGYVFHECPARATRNILKEAYRLLRNGGTIAITDNSPKSKIVQELPPVLFTLLKSTEPFLDEYYLLDLDGTMREVGFKNVVSVFTDPRHRTVTGTVQK